MTVKTTQLLTLIIVLLHLLSTLSPHTWMNRSGSGLKSNSCWLHFTWKINKLTVQNDCSEVHYKGCFCTKSVKSLRKESLPQNHINLNLLTYNLCKYDNCHTLTSSLKLLLKHSQQHFHLYTKYAGNPSLR